MGAPFSDLQQLLQALEPELHEGVFTFALLPLGSDAAALDPIATVREAEGITVVVAEAVAREHGLAALFRAARITLRVPSGLNAVGLTAAFAGALAQAGISCNVVAGACHDHLFVPVERAAQAMAVLRALQRNAWPRHTGDHHGR